MLAYFICALHEFAMRHFRCIELNCLRTIVIDRRSVLGAIRSGCYNWSCITAVEVSFIHDWVQGRSTHCSRLYCSALWLSWSSADSVWQGWKRRVWFCRWRSVRSRKDTYCYSVCILLEDIFHIFIRYCGEIMIITDVPSSESCWP